MKVLFGFQEVPKVETKGIEKLATNAIKAQHKIILKIRRKIVKPFTSSIRVLMEQSLKTLQMQPV